MPCNSDHLIPSRREEESVMVRTLLRETGRDINVGSPYGFTASLSHDTKELCDWCKTQTTEQIKSMSLELQIWWRDHQEADRIREEKYKEQIKKDEIVLRAIAKLTDEERKALGV